MKLNRHYPWFIFWLLLGLSLAMLLLNNSLPVSLEAHQVILGLSVIMLLVTAASFVYLRAQREAYDSGQWWQDDDWSHWGGI